MRGSRGSRARDLQCLQRGTRERLRRRRCWRATPTGRSRPLVAAVSHSLRDVHRQAQLGGRTNCLRVCPAKTTAPGHGRRCRGRSVTLAGSRTGRGLQRWLGCSEPCPLRAQVRLDFVEALDGKAECFGVCFDAVGVWGFVEAEGFESLGAADDVGVLPGDLGEALLSDALRASGDLVELVACDVTDGSLHEVAGHAMDSPTRAGRTPSVRAGVRKIGAQ